MIFRAFATTYQAPFGTAFSETTRTPDVEISIGLDPQPSNVDIIHDAEDFPGGPRLRVSVSDQTTWVAYRDQIASFDGPHAIKLDGDFSNENQNTKLLERVFLPIHHLLTKESTFAVHGSAVCRTEATIFIGDSGVGKSTTAFELLQRGAKLITDDLTLAHDETISGGVPVVRTWDELKDTSIVATETIAPGSEKKWVLFEPSVAQTEPVPVKQILVLRRGDAFSFDELFGGTKLQLMLDQVFGFTHPPRHQSERRFTDVSAFARKHRVFACTLPSEQRDKAYDELWRLL